MSIHAHALQAALEYGERQELEIERLRKENRELRQQKRQLNGRIETADAVLNGRTRRPEGGTMCEAAAPPGYATHEETADREPEKACACD